jgi:hypothetical protein
VISVKQQQTSIGSSGQQTARLEGKQVKHTQYTIFVTVATGNCVLVWGPLRGVVGSVERGVVGSAGSKRMGWDVGEEEGEEEEEGENADDEVGMVIAEKHLEKLIIWDGGVDWLGWRVTV